MMRVAGSLLLIATLVQPECVRADVMAATMRAKTGAIDDTGEVWCAQEVGEALHTCSVEIARSGNAAAVVVRFPNGFVRILTFEDGVFLRGNATMSGVGTDTEWRLSKGLYEVRVDDQRFVLPEALVFGD